MQKNLTPPPQLCQSFEVWQEAAGKDRAGVSGLDSLLRTFAGSSGLPLKAGQGDLETR